MAKTMTLIELARLHEKAVKAAMKTLTIDPGTHSHRRALAASHRAEDQFQLALKQLALKQLAGS